MRFKITYPYYIDLEEIRMCTLQEYKLLKDLFEYVHQGQIDIALLNKESQTLSKIHGGKF